MKPFEKKNVCCYNLAHYEPKSTNLHFFTVFRCPRLARFWFIMVKIATTCILVSELFYYIWNGLKSAYEFFKGLMNGSTGLAAYVKIKKHTPPASPSPSQSSDEVLNLRKMDDSPI